MTLARLRTAGILLRINELCQDRHRATFSCSGNFQVLNSEWAESRLVPNHRFDGFWKVGPKLGSKKGLEKVLLGPAKSDDENTSPIDYLPREHDIRD